ncbi:hypothetical protein CLU79DRAFT_716410 [Phycomyces nitens]|nr:hypothetical protein CLU79DRAFT_716410 [Phycomyces nitens]
MQAVLNEDHSHALSTPTRFLLECGEWNFTPGISGMTTEMNPFDYHFQGQAAKNPQKTERNWEPTSPVQDTSSQASSPTPSSKSADPPSLSPRRRSLSPPNQLQDSTLIFKQENGIPKKNTRSRPKRSTKISYRQDDSEDDSSDTSSTRYMQTIVSSGRKRRIVFEGDDAEEQRKKFLERNRVAAFKCRQKKKKWMQNLETHAEQVTNQNKELQTIVAQLREESIFLRNQLLAHGNCDCPAVQSYLRQSSAQLDTNSRLHYHSPKEHHYPTIQEVPTFDRYYASSLPPTLECQPVRTGLTPFLGLNSRPPTDYFSQKHTAE